MSNSFEHNIKVTENSNETIEILIYNKCCSYWKTIKLLLKLIFASGEGLPSTFDIPDKTLPSLSKLGNGTRVRKTESIVELN